MLPQDESLAARRTTPMAVRALLWKNAVLKRRHWVATLLEVAMPCLFILLLGVLKNVSTDKDVPAGWSDSATSPTDSGMGTSHNLLEPTGGFIDWIPAPMPRFYEREASMTGILLSLGAQSINDAYRLEELSSSDYRTCVLGVATQGAVSLNESSDSFVPSACGGRVSPYKLAIVPDTDFTREYFLQTMDEWYPRVVLGNGSATAPAIPSLRDSVVFYDSTEALDEYVKGDSYGDGLENPRIHGAIVFEQFPRDDQVGQFQSIEYSLRLNSTYVDQNVAGNVAKTSGDPLEVYPFRKKIEFDFYSRYAVSGFMTLQTLVTRFVTCMPEWDADTKTTTAQCQRTQSTAESSDELDDRLLAAVDADTRIQVAMNTVLAGHTEDDLVATTVPFSALLAEADPAAREAVLKPLRQVPQHYLGAAVAPFPVDVYIDSPFYDSIKDVFALVFILAYLYCVSRILVVFIQEKETRLRELIKILGVKEKAIIMSWFISYAIILFVGSVLQAAAGLVGLFANSSVVLTFLFFYLFGLSVLAFGFLISTLFSKARSGAFVGMILFFLMYFVSTVFSPSTAEGSKSIGCLLSPVALSLGVQVLANLEKTGQGIAFSNIDVLNENFRFKTALLFFAIDTVLYTVLGLYFEKVIPKDYGTTLKWYFPVSPSYWRDRRQAREAKKAKMNGVVEESGIDNTVLDVNPSFEPVTADLREQEMNGDALSVQHLRKVFAVPGGEKVAVKGMNLTMYKNQITCLLGHNGAGKTTLISMLTGMTAATSGDASFHGMSFSEDMDEIRESLGICFQHDVLYSELTVEEHLLFFARIKGYTNERLVEVVNRQIKEVGLTEKRNVQSCELSGGMKRKLSVAVSLLGDSSLVFLDEPTSGMDPYSRRSTWEILLNNRHDRVMVLTTHFMDEADILGDRIAIMSEGELRCCGSSLFLKNRYGAGYNLTLVKDDIGCNDSEVINFITAYVADAQVLSNVGSEIAFQLPLESSSKFAAMFSDLDHNLAKLKLLSYGVSVTTLEEVFIKVAEADDVDHQHTLGKGARNHDTPVSSPTGSNDVPLLEEPAQNAMFFIHLHALFMKRWCVAKRDRRMMIFSAILPVLLLLAGLLLLSSGDLTSDDPKLALTTDAFSAQDQSPTPFFCQADGDEWCSSAMSSEIFTGALPQEISSDAMTPYDSDSPTVFGVKYTDPTINASDATGYGVKFGEELFNRGYGKNGQDISDSQFGAYLVYGESDRNLFGYNVFVNTSATHSAAIFKTLMDQAVYRFFAKDTGSDASVDVDLKVNSHPLPLTASSKALFDSFLSFTACLFIVIAFTFFPASIVVFLVKEKTSTHNAKHQQFVSGVSVGAFWLSNFLWDLMMYVIPCAAALILIQLFDISAMTGTDCQSCTSETYPSVVVLFILFGLAICPFTYCMSHFFEDHASAQTYTIMINFVIGVVLMVISFILDIIDSTKDINAVLIFIWRLSPLFNLGNGLLNLSLHEFDAVLDSDKEKKSPFNTDIMGFELIFLTLGAIFFSILTLWIDYSRTFSRVSKDTTVDVDETEESQAGIDIDVAKEARRIENGANDDVIVLKGLKKVYKGGKKAVNGLTFGLKRGECFGFLGINGAGKTTTMKMLTGDVPPTSGTATLGGFDILTQQAEVRRQIGYCPQFDALFELMTVREHLELFARIKGVPATDIDDVVSEKIQQLNLASFDDKLAGSLSGGNKRKLSVAIAMIGNPRIIFLDEPSTGMDPVSRRFMWDVIAGISTRSKSATIVLTTHSMEECEALCSRVSIMVGGNLRCLGSVQHLKSRFGDGLVFDVKMSMQSYDELRDLVDRHFGESSTTVTASELEDKCRALGDAGMAQCISSSHPTGYSLAAALERDGFVGAEALCSWFTEENRFNSLSAFLQESFGEDQVQIMERQNDFCRFKLHGSNEELRLSKVFALVEDVKTTMHIREYSVSQTTLEQIFNFFAAQQEEEQGVARGMIV